MYKIIRELASIDVTTTVSMNTLAGLRDRLEKETAKVVQKNNEINELMDELKEKDEEIKNKNTEITELEEELEETKKELKRHADDSADKDEMLLLLRTPKWAKNDYIEQKPAKYVFKCMDGDIQIPQYGLLRTDFYHQVRKTLTVFKKVV